MDKDLKWTCGQETNLECQGRIGGGAFGVVYKMIEKEKRSFRLARWGKTSGAGKVFARKLVRIGYLVEMEDAQNEIEILESLSQTNGRDHIIEVLKYGWLGTSEKYFFIDMELAQLSLAQYISYVFQNESLPPNFGTLDPKYEAVFSSRECTELQRLQTSLVICSQIARGLEFMHHSGYVHRDLKPANVLYCSRRKLWKLTDFGFTSAGASTAMATRYCRGTEGYRSPELFSDETPHYSTRSDIWALGCILHELATGHRIFSHDIAMAVHYGKEPVPELPIQISYDNEFWQAKIADCLHQFLSKETYDRPNASVAFQRLSASYQLLELSQLPGMGQLTDGSKPPCVEWESVLKPGLSVVELLLDLGKWYIKNGHNEVDGWLMQIVVSRLKQHVEGKEMHSSISQNRESEVTSAPGGFWHENVALLRDIGETLVEKDDEVATVIFTGLAQNVPESVDTTIFGAAFKGDVFSLKILLERQKDVEEEDKRWALHYALWRGHEKVIELLLHHNIGVDMAYIGSTALHYAASKGYKKMIEMLLQHNADVDNEDRNGLTALHYAAILGYEKIVEILLEHNADVEKQAAGGMTALHLASASGHQKAVEMLLQHNADVDKEDGYRWTALHYAAILGYEKIIEILLEHNADVDKRDAGGHPALAYAVIHHRVVEMLKGYKAGTWTPAEKGPAIYRSVESGD